MIKFGMEIDDLLKNIDYDKKVENEGRMRTIHDLVNSFNVENELYIEQSVLTGSLTVRQTKKDSSLVLPIDAVRKLFDTIHDLRVEALSKFLKEIIHHGNNPI